MGLLIIVKGNLLIPINFYVNEYFIHCEKLILNTVLKLLANQPGY